VHFGVRSETLKISRTSLKMTTYGGRMPGPIFHFRPLKPGKHNYNRLSIHQGLGLYTHLEEPQFAWRFKPIIVRCRLLDFLFYRLDPKLRRPLRVHR
jgi:hypothetical protein